MTFVSAHLTSSQTTEETTIEITIEMTTDEQTTIIDTTVDVTEDTSTTNLTTPTNPTVNPTDVFTTALPEITTRRFSTSELPITKPLIGPVPEPEYPNVDGKDIEPFLS